VQLPDGSFALSHMDEMVDDMLGKDYMFDIALPRIPKRYTIFELI
jgi:pre-mRNA-splicing factor 38A